MEQADTAEKFRQEIEKHLSLLKPGVEDMLKNYPLGKKEIALKEYSDNLLLFWERRQNKGSSKIHAGFPFPLYTEDIEMHNSAKMKIQAFVRGEPIRGIQRGMLEGLCSEFKDVADSQEFKKMVDAGISTPTRFLYVDPYDFIGDSHIGLYFFDSFVNKFKPEAHSIFSKKSEHLKAAMPCDPYDIAEISRLCQDGDVLMAPDLIDNHWDDTLNLIRSLKDKRTTIIVPGRNLLIRTGSGKINTLHLDRPDIFLKDTNIEDYMQECLNPYGVEGIALTQERRFVNTNRFFINPFANHELRYIPVKLFFETYKNIIKDNPKAEFHLIAGYHKKRDHKKWVCDLLDLLEKDKSMHRISINYYLNLSELAQHMEERECSVVMTSDTSIAHIANRLGYPNVSLYNTKWWDEDSIQSIAGSSPMGFCRYFTHQMPVINHEQREHMNAYASLGSNIARLVLFLQKGEAEKKSIVESQSGGVLRTPTSLEEHKRMHEALSNSGLGWICGLYDPERIIKGMKGYEPARTGRLLDAALKISPLYKLGTTLGEGK